MEFQCKACGETAAIDNVGFLKGITGLGDEDLKYCADHLENALEDVTIDLSIGGGHTRSEEFKAQREQRRRDRSHGEEVAEAKKRETVTLARTIHDDRSGEHMDRPFGESVVIEMPKLAKEDLKELGWQATHRRWDDDRKVWLADATRIEMIRDHMQSKGWSVSVET